MDTRSAQGRVRQASPTAATPRGTALFLGHHRGRCSDSGRDVQGGETHCQELGQTRESLPPARGAEPSSSRSHRMSVPNWGTGLCAGPKRPWWPKPHTHTQQRCTHMLRGTRGAGRTGGWRGDTHVWAGTHGRVREEPVSQLSPLGSRKETPGPEPVAPLRLKAILSLSHSGQT